MDLTTLMIHQAADLLKRREISPLELTQAHLERIERLDPELTCFITVTADLALAAGRQAETEIQQGQYRGPLHGIPLALKDLFETEGVPTTAGSIFFRDYLPQEDAAAVKKLQAAGAVLLGKLNMHEIALGVTNVNPHYGPCRNPWAKECISGGSSGGSAAALAAGLCLGSLGSDTGGSIRIPAALCGVVGLKPTYGRVSLRGVMPLSWNLDHAGPLARCVRDAALLLQSIAGYDPVDPYCADQPVDDYLAHLTDGIQCWRIALASGEYLSGIDPEIKAAIDQAARAFEALGAVIEPVEMNFLREAAQANGLIVTSDAALRYHQYIAESPQGFGADVLQRLRAGAAASAREYSLARREGILALRQLERLFERYDLLLLPTTPIPAPPIEGPDAVEQARRLTRFTAPFNLTGLPALSLPCGFTQNRRPANGPASLPIGLQIVARPWAEARLLQAAYAYEQSTGGYQRSPVSGTGAN